MTEPIYDVVEVVTIFHSSIIGKLKDENKDEIEIFEPMLLVPGPQAMTLRPLSNIGLIDSIRLKKGHILGYTKINNPSFIKQYQQSFDKARAISLGIEVTNIPKIMK